MKKTSLTNYMKKAAGYTIDQTILIVAVIAVLITLIIASVGWDLLNRTSGTKFASYLKQIEEANGAFYARQGVWPHTAVAQIAAFTGNANENNIGVLAAVDPLGGAGAANDYVERFKPFLTGFDVEITADSDAVVSHEFGSGGVITQEELPFNTVPTYGDVPCDPTKNVMEISMVGVPIPELENADEAIDGEVNNLEGRLQWTAPVGGIADMSYCANLLN